MLLDMQDSVTGGLQRLTVGSPTEKTSMFGGELFLEKAADASEGLDNER